ncbi:hypothetical protein DYB36_002707 [Aphanomyces astaci]|uniref:non-specific serine/threonine protein kinase n=1 Tax=Aphanomyces astaci TaxID=112090 RepID=A0A397B0E0_APHAT|nr:hypothetical protein DYB36_002707 [Aphanomyces astaci]
MIRRQKDLFTISDSTCTLQRRPPELLAALAGVQTPKQQKSLAIAEHRYFEQSRSQQLRDYKHDKEDAKPKRYLRAPIVDVDQQDPDEGWHNAEAELTAAMNALYAEWVQEQRDLSPLIPTANSPPAAQRYYGTIKQMPPSMDQYEHVRVIGKGSFGIVSKILRKVDNKELVWKEVDYGQMTEKEKQLIVSEVNILRELKHPHIVRYLDRVIDKQSTKIFIVMEYCEGGDLSRLIKRHRRDGPPFDATNQLALAKKISAGKFSRIPDEYAAKMKELFSIQEDLQKQEALLLVRETQLHGNVSPIPSLVC